MNIEIKIPVRSLNGEENRLVAKYITFQRESGATDDQVSLTMPDGTSATVAYGDFSKAAKAFWLGI